MKPREAMVRRPKIATEANVEVSCASITCE